MSNEPAEDSTASAADVLSRSFSYVSEDDAPPSRSLLRDKVYAHIRSFIVQGHLFPGMQLRDLQIAESMGVSRTPVREAIRRLQDEGLLIAEAGRWTKVAPVSITTADDVYPMIGALERLAVGQSGPWTKKMISDLRAANRRMTTALKAKDAVAASAADYEFHGVIVRASGNRHLANVVKELKAHLHRLEALYFAGSSAADISVQEHEKVIDALVAKDIETAAVAVQENWRASLERVHTRLHAGDGSEAADPLRRASGAPPK